MKMAEFIRNLKFEKIKVEYLNGNIDDRDLIEKLKQAENESQALCEEWLGSEKIEEGQED